MLQNTLRGTAVWAGAGDSNPRALEECIGLNYLATVQDTLRTTSSAVHRRVPQELDPLHSDTVSSSQFTVADLDQWFSSSQAEPSASAGSGSVVGSGSQPRDGLAGGNQDGSASARSGVSSEWLLAQLEQQLDTIIPTDGDGDPGNAGAATDGSACSGRVPAGAGSGCKRKPDKRTPGRVQSIRSGASAPGGTVGGTAVPVRSSGSRKRPLALDDNPTAPAGTATATPAHPPASTPAPAPVSTPALAVHPPVSRTASSMRMVITPAPAAPLLPGHAPLPTEPQAGSSGGDPIPDMQRLLRELEFLTNKVLM